MQKTHRLINDNIYHHIEYTQLEDCFLQTKVVNRLLFITQNAWHRDCSKFCVSLI